MRNDQITPTEYGGLQEAYDHFNTVLFSGVLPYVFITYQRRAHTYGYFSADRFAGRTEAGDIHELALNPDGFVGRTDKAITSTLVHEQVHVWQKACGKPSKRGYHNKEWVRKMLDIGLMPSSTGMVGGKRTGQRVTHYVIPGGAFERAFEQLAEKGWKLSLQSAVALGPPGGCKNKSKFTCAQCGQNAWGKPGLSVICEPCLRAACETAKESGLCVVLLTLHDGTIGVFGLKRGKLADAEDLETFGFTLTPLHCVDRTDEEPAMTIPVAA